MRCFERARREPNFSRTSGGGRTAANGPTSGRSASRPKVGRSRGIDLCAKAAIHFDQRQPRLCALKLAVRCALRRPKGTRSPTSEYGLRDHPDAVEIRSGTLRMPAATASGQIRRGRRSALPSIPPTDPGLPAFSRRRSEIQHFISDPLAILLAPACQSIRPASDQARPREPKLPSLCERGPRSKTEVPPPLRLPNIY